jgi:Spy/CpxP family protein refolding chaperone
MNLNQELIMKKFGKKLCAVAIVTGLLGGVLPIQSAEAHPRSCKRPGVTAVATAVVNGLKNIAVTLQLTTDQKTEIKAILQANGVALKEAWGEVKDLRKAHIATIRQEVVDEAAIRSTQGALSDAYLELSLLRANVYSQVVGVLTPEQKQKLAAEKEKMEASIDAIIAKIQGAAEEAF